jgi:hypothetical protein
MVRYQHVAADGTIDMSTTACPTDEEPSIGPTVADIRTAFKQIPMAASTMHIQPPRGETLVNFDTIFYADPTTVDRKVTVLGATVDFHITVANYTWHYGDGATQRSTDPGAAYPHQSIVHRYRRKGTVTASVDTTYQADYRIDGGPLQHLDATVTIPGPSHRLRVRTAKPHLVGGRTTVQSG